MFKLVLRIKKIPDFQDLFHFTDDGQLHDEADVLLAFLLNSTEDFHDTIDNGSISSSESNQSLEFGVDEIPGLTWHNDCETSIIEVNFKYISKLKFISENSDLVADEIQRLWPDMEVVRMRDCQTETKYKVKEAAIKASEIMTEVGLKSGMNTLGFQKYCIKYGRFSDVFRENL